MKRIARRKTTKRSYNHSKNKHKNKSKRKQNRKRNNKSRKRNKNPAKIQVGGLIPYTMIVHDDVVEPFFKKDFCEWFKGKNLGAIAQYKATPDPEIDPAAKKEDTEYVIAWCNRFYEAFKAEHGFPDEFVKYYLKNQFWIYHHQQPEWTSTKVETGKWFDSLNIDVNIFQYAGSVKVKKGFKEFLTKHAPEAATDDLCSICLSSMDSGEIITILDCRHIFHHECIESWEIAGNQTCPLCRQVWNDHSSIRLGEV